MDKSVIKPPKKCPICDGASFEPGQVGTYTRVKAKIGFYPDNQIDKLFPKISGVLAWRCQTCGHIVLMSI